MPHSSRSHRQWSLSHLALLACALGSESVAFGQHTAKNVPIDADDGEAGEAPPAYLPPPSLVPHAGRKAPLGGNRGDVQSDEGNESEAETHEGEQRRPRDGSIGFAYVMTPAQPATYERIVYISPEDGGRYESDAEAGPATLGVALIARRSFGRRWMASMGLRYRQDEAFTGEGVFDERDEAHAMKDEVRASAVGLWLDLMPGYTRLGPTTTLESGIGIDIDRSTVQLVETFRDDRPGLLARKSTTTVTSTLLVASLRLVGGIRQAFGSFEIGLQAAVMAPLADGMATVEADTGADAKAWSEALEHRASTGAEILTTLALRL